MGWLSIPLPPHFSYGDLRHGQRVCQQCSDTPKRTVRLVKDTQLPKERCPVVVDPLACQALGRTVVGVADRNIKSLCDRFRIQATSAVADSYLIGEPLQAGIGGDHVSKFAGASG